MGLGNSLRFGLTFADNGERLGLTLSDNADVQALNAGLQAFSLVSFASTNPAVFEAQEAREALQDVPGIALSDYVIRDRKVYRDAFFEGVGVVEMTHNKATPEVQLLAQEVFNG